ncbi:proline dehydrogenase family protein [Algoriphagus pacificus]|uniref:Proline dehydrogenase family protein n=1 Tax=Algoriphagus pacificus TaxID=2811234 RepID=A0ABS3CEZ7_9BACT|nr:proline dehydrogenase family protein [Algoriphagus pacificus]MBN7815675.1 proline dehydrogenase family protein [Algoriphagus pacificus]
MPTKSSISFENLEVAFASKSDAELKKMHLVFSLLNNKTLSDIGIALTHFALKLKLPIKWIMKQTMFGHFCGGETIKESIKACEKLAEFGIEAILDYSVEGKGDEESFERTTEEIRQTMVESAKTDYMPFGVIKVTGLGDYHNLIKIQAGEKLNPQEQIAYDKTKARVDLLCKTAHDLGLKILIDAEESWFQDAVDNLAYEAMEKYNLERCVVYNTYQMYRHDMLGRLKKAKEAASQKGYLLGAKLVRGAYMEKEGERAEKYGYPSPIQPSKAATDKDYNAGVEFCIENKDIVFLMSGSHNENSNYLVAELMNKYGVDPKSDKVFFAQLYGMSDNISFNLAKAGYRVVKYVPYGPVEKVMPYLTRRAAENSSIAGQSSREFELIKREMKRRNSK